MIIFYNKKNGDIFGFIQGRVHDKFSMNMSISNSNIKEKDIEKIIIGWGETDETETIEEEKEVFVEVENGLFKKEKQIEKREITKRKTHNKDLFDLMYKFEDETPFSPLDCKIDLKTKKVIFNK